MIKDLIFDLGMNNGDDTDFYLRKGFRVVAVEPNPDLCAAARQRFASDIANGRLHIVEKAIDQNGGEIDLFLNDQVSGWTTTDANWLKLRTNAGTASRVVKVPAVTCQGLVEEFGVPYYLKADVQGAERHCLEALLQFADRPKCLSIASGAKFAGGRVMRVVREEIDLISRLGYRKFKIIRQDQTELQKCPSPASEGHYVDYRFTHGMSGLFGSELPGDWIDAEAAVRELRRVAISYKFAGSSECGWFRAVPNATIKYRLDRLFWRGTTWFDTHAMRD
jgi:FkbM family methyltransferase